MWFINSIKNYLAQREALKRRKNYDALKAEISKEHYQGFDRLIVSSKKYDETDMKSFRYPMYKVLKTVGSDFCITWDRKKLTEEIGDGTPHDETKENKESQS